MSRQTIESDRVRLSYSRRGHGAARLTVRVTVAGIGDRNFDVELEWAVRSRLLAQTNQQLQAFVDWLAAGVAHDVLAALYVERKRAVLMAQLVIARATVADYERKLAELPELMDLTIASA